MNMKLEQIFVNLPVKDLQKSMAFYREVGFEFNPQFTDDNAACMVVSEQIYIMLLVESFFQTFTKKAIADATQQTEVIVSFAAESKDMVNEIVNRALAAGAKPSNDPTDHGFMYVWSFQDPDGHLWEIFHMDPSVIDQA